jgi:hypothetical protein
MDNLRFSVEGRPDEAETGTMRVWVDGLKLDPAKSQALRNHSPTGFQVGYGGSSPAQTALAICLHIFQSSYVAQAVYQAFKWDYVAQWSPEPGFNVLLDLTDFVIEQREAISRARAAEAEDRQWQIEAGGIDEPEEV